MSYRAIGLQGLPVELLYELELYSLSEYLPLTSHHLHNVFKHASPFFLAQYILGRATRSLDSSIAEIFTHALLYPICDQRVVQALNDLLKSRKPLGKGISVQLPRRLFRYLSTPSSGWTAKDEPIPFLQFLCNTPGIPTIDVNSYDGYALTKAVHARFVPLAEFLLGHHASPKCHHRLAVKVAIRQKNLDMLKLLVEKRTGKQGKGKKRKLEDRVTLDASLLKIALNCDASNIVDYLYREKGVVPDFETLKKL